MFSAQYFIFKQYYQMYNIYVYQNVTYSDSLYIFIFFFFSLLLILQEIIITEHSIEFFIIYIFRLFYSHFLMG